MKVLPIFNSAHLCEVIWRNHHPCDRVQHLFELIAKVYDVNNGKVHLNLPADVFRTLPDLDPINDRFVNEMELEEGVDQINGNPNEASVVEEAQIDLDISVVLPIADVKTPEVRLFLLSNRAGQCFYNNNLL